MLPTARVVPASLLPGQRVPVPAVGSAVQGSAPRGMGRLRCVSFPKRFPSRLSVSLQAPTELQCSSIFSALCPSTLILPRLWGSKHLRGTRTNTCILNVILKNHDSFQQYLPMHAEALTSAVTWSKRKFKVQVSHQEHTISMKQRPPSSSCRPSLCASPSSFAYSTSSSLDSACSTLLCHYKCMLTNVLWRHVTSHEILFSRSEVHQDTRNSRHLHFVQHRKHRCPLKL